MWRNYLLVALRLMARHRVHAAITIGGLALGLAGCLLIVSYVRVERGYDRWIPDHERVLQVQTTSREPGQPVTRSQASPFPVRDMLPGGFPQIEAITVVRTGQTVLTRQGRPEFVDHASVDPAFFDIFGLPFVDGSAATALKDPNAIVLTESQARRLLGASRAVGRTLTLGAGPGKRDRRVSGVLRDLPRNSSLRLAIIVRNDPNDFASAAAGETGWGAMSQQHYVKVRAPEDAAAINAALPAWEKRVVAPQVIDGAPMSQADIMDLRLVPIADVHLGEAQLGALAPGGDPDALATFVLVALMTLGLAVVNFVNLSTARASLRAREVGLRKLLGATRARIVAQMLAESLLTVAAAMLLALAIVEVAAPWVADRTGVELRIAYLGQHGLAWPALLLFLVTGLAGGLYPAFHLSRFPPATVLRGGRAAADTANGGRLRTGLVVLQFAVAIGLIISTWVIYGQTRFVAGADPGFRRDGLIQIDAAWRFAGEDSEFQAARPAVLAVPGVVDVGRTGLGLVATNTHNLSVTAPGAVSGLSIGVYGVDPGFFTTMDLRLAAGRFLGDRFAGDRVSREPDDFEIEPPARAINVVVNRSAARLLGHASPQAALGRTVGIGSGETTPATIVGVVEDTRVRTPRDPAEPIIYSYDPARTDSVVLRYAGARPAEVMAGLERVWRRFEPEIPFQAAFAEALTAETLTAENARGALFAGFALLAGAIAVLGLYALAAFVTDRRVKEIGIRKVLGARTRDIVRLLAWQFSRPVMVANLVAWPVAWWAMRGWLNGFDLRVVLQPTPFVVTGLAALAIALATVSGHAIRVARLNPIHALRYE